MYYYGWITRQPCPTLLLDQEQGCFNDGGNKLGLKNRRSLPSDTIVLDSKWHPVPNTQHSTYLLKIKSSSKLDFSKVVNVVVFFAERRR